MCEWLKSVGEMQRDNRLVGRWRLDPACKQPEYIEDSRFEFSADGVLVYRYLHDGDPSSITLTYGADGYNLVTQNPNDGKVSKATYEFDGEENLIVTTEAGKDRYLRDGEISG